MSLMPIGKSAQRRRGERRIVRRAARTVEIERGEGADLGLARSDRLRAKIDDRARREFAGLDPARQVERRQHQAFPSIAARIRSVRRRAACMMTKPVAAATGQAMK